MTAPEAYDLITNGGASDFARLIAICESLGNYCLIGGLAVNFYVEPVYTLDADLVTVIDRVDALRQALEAEGFRTEQHRFSLNASRSDSQLRVQFSTDKRYQAFPSRAIRGAILGVDARIACLEDLVQGKLWAYADPQRRFSKRKKDELDLIRLAEAYPHLQAKYPPALLAQIQNG